MRMKARPPPRRERSRRRNPRGDERREGGRVPRVVSERRRDKRVAARLAILMEAPEWSTRLCMRYKIGVVTS